MKLKLEDGREVEVKGLKKKHLREFFAILQKVGDDPDKVEEYLDYQTRLIEEVTGIGKQEQEELSLASVEKIMDYIVGKMVGATGFTTLWKQQQNLPQTAR